MALTLVDTPKPSVDGKTESSGAQSSHGLDDIPTLPAQWRQILSRHYGEKPHNAHLDTYLHAIARCEKTMPHCRGDSPSIPIHEAYVIEANNWVTSKHPFLSPRNAVIKSMLSGKNIAGRRVRVGVQGIVQRTLDLDVEMIQNLWEPDPAIYPGDIKFALDVKGLNDTVDLRQPECVTRELHYDKRIDVACNVTPKYTCVDVHSDGALHIWTVCDGLKLWIFWPPTDRNLEQFFANRCSENMLDQLYDKLEGGQYAITLDGEGVYVPPRWLHATYSLESSTPTGCTWTSAEALEIVTQSMRQEFENPGGHPDIEVMTWLQSLKEAIKVARKACFESVQSTCLKDDMNKEGIEDALGSEGQDLVKLVMSAFGKWENKFALSQQCDRCKQEIRIHLPFEKATSSRTNRARQRIGTDQSNGGTKPLKGQTIQVDGARKRRRKE